jgi:hypothetical protein
MLSITVNTSQLGRGARATDRPHYLIVADSDSSVLDNSTIRYAPVIFSGRARGRWPPLKIQNGLRTRYETTTGRGGEGRGGDGMGSSNPRHYRRQESPEASRQQSNYELRGEKQ